MKASTLPTQELAERPQGYQGPNLSPRGLRLLPTQLAAGTYALVANIPPRTTTAWSWGSGRPW
jgi:cyclase